jgi:hypothetical protein
MLQTERENEKGMSMYIKNKRNISKREAFGSWNLEMMNTVVKEFYLTLNFIILISFTLNIIEVQIIGNIKDKRI